MKCDPSHQNQPVVISYICFSFQNVFEYTLVNCMENSKLYSTQTNPVIVCLLHIYIKTREVTFIPYLVLRQTEQPVLRASADQKMASPDVNFVKFALRKPSKPGPE